MSPDHPEAGLEEALSRAVTLLQGADELALACHVTPDGDALGSMLGLHHLARSQGRRSVASWPAPFTVADHYRSVPGLELATAPHLFPAAPDLMLTFDCGSLARLNELGAPAKAARELVVIDHHATNDRYGTVNAVDVDAAATAVVVRELARRLGWPLTREAAWCLYTGIVTDTGRFQYASTTPAVFALAQELAEFDLPIARLSRELFDEHRFAYLKLAARVLDRAELDESVSLVSSWVSQEDLAHFGVAYEEVEGLIDWVRTAAEAEVTCLAKEAHDGVRVSMRAREVADVGAVAIALGGGGHRLASGFTMDAPIPAVLAAVRAQLLACRRPSDG